MLKRILTLAGLGAFVLIFILASLASASSPPPVPSAAGELYAPDRILVRFAPGVSASTRTAIHRANGAVLIREIPQIGVQVLRVPTNRVPEIVTAYSRNPNVLYAEPDYVAYALEDPDDSYFTKQWGLDNDGQVYKYIYDEEGNLISSISGTVDADIDAPEAWDITTGAAGIKIAILDSGIDQDHEDLTTKIVDNEDFTGSGTVDDKYGHGTHVAGIAAAKTNNTQGVAGVGYNSSLMNVKVLNDEGWGYNSWIADGIVWATNNGAQAINMSLGGYRRSRTLENAVNYAWNKGVVLAAAAGNDGSSRKLYPAAYSNCIAVAATDAHDQRVDEPDWWASNYGDWVDVAAPGLYIYSTFPNHDYVIGKSLEYDYGSGTSMATPHVAGLAGLLFGQDASRTNAQVRTFIEDTADPISGTGTYWVHGRINACKAVGGTECDAPVDNPPSVSVVDPIEGQTVSGVYRVLVSASDDSAVTLVELSIDGDAYIEIKANFDGTSYYYDWVTTGYDDGSHTLQARATDDAAQSTESALVNVTVDNVDEPPTATIVNPTDGSTVAGVVTIQVEATDDRDAKGTLTVEVSIDSGAWQATTYNSSSGYYEWDWDTTDLTDGTQHTIDAHATDSGGNTTYAAQVTVTVDNTVPSTMHVGDLDGVKDLKGRSGNWEVFVTVTIHDESHNPVANATVTGEWSGATTGTVSGTTASDGTVTLTTGTMKGGSSVTFTVDNVTHDTLTYDANANHDVDVFDTNGTTITVDK